MWNQLREYVYLRSETIQSQLKFEFECQQGRHTCMTYIPEKDKKANNECKNRSDSRYSFRQLTLVLSLVSPPLLLPTLYL